MKKFWEWLKSLFIEEPYETERYKEYCREFDRGKNCNPDGKE